MVGYGLSSGENGCVRGGGLTQHRRGGESFLCSAPSGYSHCVSQRWVREQASDGCRKCSVIFGWNDESGDAILHCFGVSTDVGCDNGEGCGHGFDDGVGEALAARGENEDVGFGEMLAQVGDAAVKAEVIGEAQLLDQCLQLREIFRLEHIACDAEGDVGEVWQDRSGCLEEDIVSFDAADMADGGDQETSWRLGGRRSCIPVGEVQAVIDGLDAGRVDVIALDAMVSDLIGDGEDCVRRARHQAIGRVVFG